jgi:uncharacterized damage-inducible protein DinB
MTTTILKKGLASLVFLFMTFLSLQAQQNPPASPPTTATGKIGAATITINYNSPSVKGRQIWGALVPYDKVWRAGANKTTTFETDKDLTIEGKPLVSGKYSIFAIPNEKEWKIIFNAETGQWGIKRGGDSNRDPAKDILTVVAKPAKSATMNEKLVYEITDKGFVLKWENIEVPLAIVASSISSGTNRPTEAEAMVKEWERAKAYTKEYLEAMPETGYALKPTPEMRSFAEQMLHLTDALYGLGSAGFGSKSPAGTGEAEKGADKSKENVTKLVLAGYDYIINGIGRMSSVQFNENVQVFGKFDMTKVTVLNKAFEHQTHHRGQTTVYIRLAGAKPPQEKLF